MIGVLLRIYSKTCECQRSLTCLFRHSVCLQNMNQKQNKQFTGPLLRFLLSTRTTAPPGKSAAVTNVKHHSLKVTIPVISFNPEMTLAVTG